MKAGPRQLSLGHVHAAEVSGVAVRPPQIGAAQVDPSQALTGYRGSGWTITRPLCNLPSAVIQSFADETTADLFRERNTRHARRIPRELWRGVQRKLKALDVAVRLEDLLIPAGNKLERLKGNQSGRHSIRVNDQFRVTFRWEQAHAYEVRVEGYH